MSGEGGIDVDGSPWWMTERRLGDRRAGERLCGTRWLFGILSYLCKGLHPRRNRSGVFFGVPYVHVVELTVVVIQCFTESLVSNTITDPIQANRLPNRSRVLSAMTFHRSRSLANHQF